MRKDMHHLIKETKETRRTRKKRPYKHRLDFKDGDDWVCPPREPIRNRSWRTGANAPVRYSLLTRFLDSLDGHPWAQVHRQIAQLGRKGLHGANAKDYMLHLIAHPVFENSKGELEVLCGVYGKYRLVTETFFDYYVDPNTLEFKKIERKAFRGYISKRFDEVRAQMKDNHRLLEDGRLLICVEGVWYEIGFGKIPPNEWRLNEKTGELEEYYEPVFDKLFKIRLSLRPNWLVFDPVNPYEVIYGRTGVYAKSKRQLSHKELDFFGIKNGDSNISLQAWRFYNR